MRLNYKSMAATLAVLTLANPGSSIAQTATPVVVQQGAKVAIPQPETLVILIRTTLIALNQANQTGNYAVFHALAAPGFQAAATADQLIQSFAPLRAANLDLSPVAVVTPELNQAPVFTKEGLLRLTGRFPTKPVQINFDLAFQPNAGRWLMTGLAVEPVQLVAEKAAEPPKSPVKTTPVAPSDKKKTP